MTVRETTRQSALAATVVKEMSVSAPEVPVSDAV